MSPTVTLLRAREVAEIVRDNPLAEVASRSSDLLVTVARTKPDLRLLRPLLARAWAPEVLAVGRRVAYLWCADGVAKSPLRIAVERALGRAGTARNIATFTKLAALLAAPGFSGRESS